MELGLVRELFVHIPGRRSEQVVNSNKYRISVGYRVACDWMMKGEDMLLYGEISVRFGE